MEGPFARWAVSWEQILILGVLGIAVAGEAAWAGARRARRWFWLGAVSDAANRKAESAAAEPPPSRPVRPMSSRPSHRGVH